MSPDLRSTCFPGRKGPAPALLGAPETQLLVTVMPRKKRPGCSALPGSPSLCGHQLCPSEVAVPGLGHQQAPTLFSVGFTFVKV